ncbi:MFS general substrate transporter [Gloeophyllum trabeum ATCC 11539]|uniref:MFS general substrate transporter n=1 Tax=Gloeophyllum trabeum (strain ATCC 11539 / FP-39264 / Madison 617) TaxID=670483 RepID=S7RJC8_GLOTA|nr:MFS general substrate transporter [Gloeophyllum trabeum ATCC 11539]EPQ54440.1 MFS general substrate transporter [Gloeophyllum trabeum ATCC 11539]
MSSIEKETESQVVIESADQEADRQLLRKVDLHLLPILTGLYLLSFLDRSNIGNAKLDGLAADLHLSPSGYNNALAVYFVAYVIFEIPANIILKRFDPQYWLPTLTLAWGVVSVAQGLITNQAGLFGIRFLLGATEAGLFPGVIYVFSVYYRRRERHWRVAVFFGGAALAGAFGGVLAYLIGLMDGVSGRRGWNWIFIIEGIITVVVSLAAYFIVPTWSTKAKFLTDIERERLLARLRADSDAANQEGFDWTFVRQAFTDHLVWAYAFLFHGFSFALYTLSLFLPTIIAGLGFAAWKAQLMSVPPNALAAFSIWGAAWASSRYKMRAPFIIGGGIVGIIGYVVLLATKTPGAQYAGVHLATAGVYTGNALLLSWPSENVSGQTKRAVAVAMQITIGDIGAIAGVLIYRPSFSAHLYRKPNIITIGYLVFAIAVTTYLWVWMARENRRRDCLMQQSKESLPDDEERVRLGDRAIDYRYQL